MGSAFIDDGYSIDDAPIRGDGFDEFRISYRPALPAEERRLAMGMYRANESGDNARILEWQARIVETLAAKITRWSLTDSKGQAVKISKANIDRLHANAFARIHELVMGYACFILAIESRSARRSSG